MVEVCRVSMVLVGSRSDGVTCNPRSTPPHRRGHSGRGVAAEAGVEAAGSNTRVRDAGVVGADDEGDSIGDC